MEDQILEKYSKYRKVSQMFCWLNYFVVVHVTSNILRDLYFILAETLQVKNVVCTV